MSVDVIVTAESIMERSDWKEMRPIERGAVLDLLKNVVQVQLMQERLDRKRDRLRAGR